MQSLYGNVLKQSWQVVWKAKYLWFLGILATLFAGSIEIELLENFINKGRNNFLGMREFLAGGLFNPDLLMNLKSIFAQGAQNASLIISFFLIFLLVLLAIVSVSVISQMVIIDHTAQIKKSKDKIRPTIVGSVSKLWHRLLSVISLNLLVKIFIYLTFFIVSLPIVLSLTKDSALANSIYMLLFVILLPTAIIFSFVVKYIISFIVVYNQSLRLAIRNGWKLFIENWLVSIEMSFMLFLLHILASLVIVILISALSIPLWFLAAIGSATIGSWFFISIIVFSFALFLVIFMIGGGLIMGYITSAWTVLFIKLNEEGGASKIVRTVAKLSNK